MGGCLCLVRVRLGIHAFSNVTAALIVCKKWSRLRSGGVGARRRLLLGVGLGCFFETVLVRRVRVLGTVGGDMDEPGVGLAFLLDFLDFVIRGHC